MRRAQDRARSATIESRALGALKLSREKLKEQRPQPAKANRWLSALK